MSFPSDGRMNPGKMSIHDPTFFGLEFTYVAGEGQRGIVYDLQMSPIISVIH